MMNERINQLAEQAGYPDYMTYGQDKVLERFAELIVRECAIIAFEEWQHNSTSGESAILKHFGVEE